MYIRIDIYCREDVEDENTSSAKSQNLLKFMNVEKSPKSKSHTFFDVRNLHQTVKL